MRHPIAWLTWLSAVLLCLSSTRNPLYLLVLLLAISLTGWRTPVRGESGLPFAPLRLLALFVPLAALFNLLTAHFGETVLLRLPEGIPLLGGALTLEGLVFGALNGLLLGGMLLAFQVLNRALPLRDLLRLVPRAFYPLAVVISIALTFLPLTIRQWEQIRAAQAVRGHRVRGLRDLPPLFLPLLVGSLERAFQLAEALAARGFAARSPSLRSAERLALIGSLAALSSGWLLSAAWGRARTGALLLATGLFALAWVVWRVRRLAPAPIAYRPLRWQVGDTAGTAALALGAALWLWAAASQASLRYTPYPRLQPPAADWLPLLALCVLSVPAFLSHADSAH